MKATVIKAVENRQGVEDQEVLVKVDGQSRSRKLSATLNDLRGMKVGQRINIEFVPNCEHPCLVETGTDATIHPAK